MNAWVFVVSKSEIYWWFKKKKDLIGLSCEGWQQTLDLPTNHCCPKGRLPKFEERDLQRNCPHQNTGWKMDTLYLLVSIWRKLTTLCMSLWSFRQKKKLTIQPVWRYNVGNLFVARPKRVLKRELWIFLLPQTDCNCSKRYKWTIEEPLTSGVVCLVAI